MSCLYNAVFVHEISFWVIDRVIHKCNAARLRFLFHIFIPVVLGDALRGILYLSGNCAYFAGYFGGENCISNEYRPTNLLTCSTDMGLLRHCKISEMPQLGWECPGVSYWVWQNFKKEKEERAGRGREREREREREGGGERERGETDREEGRRGEQNKNNEKKSKHWFAVTYCQNCDAPFFPHPWCPFRLCGDMFYWY